MELKLELDPARMPVAVAFVESAAQSAGFEERERSLLALSVEELFLALCSTMPDSEVWLQFRDLRYAAEVCFRFPQPPPDLRIFNITARPDHESDEGLANMGLFLASRACDQFSVQQIAQGDWEILLRKERRYPTTGQLQAAAATPCNGWSISTTPSPDAVKQLSNLIAAQYATAQFPEAFTPPGLLLDKLASANYGVILAQGDRGELAGGLIWRTTGRRIVDCFGPYLNSPADPEQLVDALCEQLCHLFGRSSYLGMMLYAPQAVPASAGFEPSGSLDRSTGSIWTGYRMLAEEFGAMACLPEELIPFYRHWSDGMALTRQLRVYHDSGESGNRLTLFGTRLNPTAGMAQLTPLLVGRDAGQILAEHLDLLDNEGYSTICCTLDTGRPFNSLLAPHLLAHGFTPRILVPWGGDGDLLQLYRMRGQQ
jgi:hypothetical protein